MGYVLAIFKFILSALRSKITLTLPPPPYVSRLSDHTVYPLYIARQTVKTHPGFILFFFYRYFLFVASVIFLVVCRMLQTISKKKNVCSSSFPFSLSCVILHCIILVIFSIVRFEHGHF